MCIRDRPWGFPLHPGQWYGKDGSGRWVVQSPDGHRMRTREPRPPRERSLAWTEESEYHKTTRADGTVEEKWLKQTHRYHRGR